MSSVTCAAYHTEALIRHRDLIVDFVEMNGYLQISQINRQMSGTLACQAVNGVEPRAIRKMRLDIRCE